MNEFWDVELQKVPNALNARPKFEPLEGDGGDDDDPADDGDGEDDMFFFNCLVGSPKKAWN